MMCMCFNGTDKWWSTCASLIYEGLEYYVLHKNKSRFHCWQTISLAQVMYSFAFEVSLYFVRMGVSSGLQLLMGPLSIPQMIHGALVERY
jgi:hypothetical protein